MVDEENKLRALKEALVQCAASSEHRRATLLLAKQAFEEQAKEHSFRERLRDFFARWTTVPRIALAGGLALALTLMLNQSGPTYKQETFLLTGSSEGDTEFDSVALAYAEFVSEFPEYELLIPTDFELRVDTYNDETVTEDSNYESGLDQESKVRGVVLHTTLTS